jgi:hypothetical protein
VRAPAPLLKMLQSGTGVPHSKTLRVRRARGRGRQVLERARQRLQARTASMTDIFPTAPVRTQPTQPMHPTHPIHPMHPIQPMQPMHPPHSIIEAKLFCSPNLVHKSCHSLRKAAAARPLPQSWGVPPIFLVQPQPAGGSLGNGFPGPRSPPVGRPLPTGVPTSSIHSPSSLFHSGFCILDLL